MFAKMADEMKLPKCPFCGKELVRVAWKRCSYEEYFCRCKKWQERGFKLTRG